MFKTQAHVVDARNNRHLRHLNLERLLSVAMERTEPFTRAELTEATSLSVPTVGTLTGHLIRRGLLSHLGTGPSRGGRRPSFMEFNAQYGFVAGVVLSARNTLVALADLRGKRLAARTWPTPMDLPPAALLTKLVGWLRTLLADSNVPVEKLLALTMAFPGPVDHKRGVVALAVNFKGWEQMPVARMLKEQLGGTLVVIENDVNLAVQGERWRGAANGHNTCAFVYVGTAIGSGVVIGGELHHGHHFLAGEIGLMRMSVEDLGPDNRSRSLEGLLKGLPERWNGRGDFLEAAKRGDARAKKLIEEAARLVGLGISNLSLAIDPSLIVLGGPLVEVREFLSTVRQVVAGIDPSPPEIVPARLGDESALWGTLLVATQTARDNLRQSLANEIVPAEEEPGSRTPTSAGA